MLHNTAVTNNGRQSVLMSRMLLSKLYNIMVNKVIFVGFRGRWSLQSPPIDTPLGGSGGSKFRLTSLIPFLIFQDSAETFHNQSLWNVGSGLFVFQHKAAVDAFHGIHCTNIVFEFLAP